MNCEHVALSRWVCAACTMASCVARVSCRGLYRSSVSAEWLYPDEVIPAGSTVQESLKAVHTPLVPVHESRARSGPRSAQIRVPKGALPAFLAFSVYVPAPEGGAFLRLQHGTFASVPLGVGIGAPAPLGATILARDGDAAAAAVTVNFAVTSRHAGARCHTDCVAS